jgi:hypothetical protein
MDTREGDIVEKLRVLFLAKKCSRKKVEKLKQDLRKGILLFSSF